MRRQGCGSYACRAAHAAQGLVPSKQSAHDRWPQTLTRARSARSRRQTTHDQSGSPLSGSRGEDVSHSFSLARVSSARRAYSEPNLALRWRWSVRQGAGRCRNAARQMGQLELESGSIERWRHQKQKVWPQALTVGLYSSSRQIGHSTSSKSCWRGWCRGGCTVRASSSRRMASRSCARIAACRSPP
eukprot:scaffold11611_cov25-Tisochrysis_lutea.AAC.2